MQTAPKGTYSGMFHCAGGILKNEGPLAFYKVRHSIAPSHLPMILSLPSRSCLQGTLTPLLGIGVCVSIQFGALEYSKRFFAKRNLEEGKGGPTGLYLTGPQLVASGIFAGVANGVVSGPVEHIRIRA